MNKMCDKWSRAIYLDGFAAQRKVVWVASLWTVAVASTVYEQWGQFALP